MRRELKGIEDRCAEGWKLAEKIGQDIILILIISIYCYNKITRTT